MIFYKEERKKTMMRVFKLMTNGNFEDLTMFDYKSSDKDKDSYEDFSDFIMQ